MVYLGVRIAFYRSEHGGLLDWLIAKHDGGPYSHVELVFESSDLLRRDDLHPLCFSSSARDGGTRFKRIDVLTSGKWDLIDVPLDAAAEERVYLWCMARAGRPYDYPGVLAFKIFGVGQHQSRWFCSEISLAAVQAQGLLTGVKPHKVSPNKLAKMARQLAV